MLTFNHLEWIERSLKRKNPRYGFRVSNVRGLYAQRTAPDNYNILFVWRKWEKTENGYVPLPMKFAHTRLIAQVKPNGFVIHDNTTCPNAIRRHFDVFSYRHKLGRTIWYKGSVFVGNLPIQVEGETLTVGPKDKECIDTAKCDEFNRLIKSVRNALRVRDKLGMFGREIALVSNYRAAKELLSAIQSVSEDDFETFKRLVTLCRSRSGTYGSALDAFERAIKAERRNMAIEFGALQIEKSTYTPSWVESVDGQ